MEDFIKAVLAFLTDLFAALGEFLGGSFAFGDIIGGLEDAFGGETTTAKPAEGE